MARRPAAGDGE